MTTTRRTATPTLVAGQTYNIAQPRKVRRIHHKLTVPYPLTNQAFTVSEGVPVPVGNPEPLPVARQTILPGMLVRLKNARVQYVDRSAIPESIRGEEHYRAQISRSQPSTTWMVIAVDGDFMRVTYAPISCGAYSGTREVDGRIKFIKSSRAVRNPVSGMYETPEPKVLDAMGVRDHLLNGNFSAYGINDSHFLESTINYASLARVRHIVEIVSPDAYDDSVWEGIKLAYRSTRVKAMYTRLAAAAAAARTGAPHTGGYYEPYTRSRRANAALRVSNYIKAAVDKFIRGEPWHGHIGNAISVATDYTNRDDDVKASILKSFAKRVGVESVSYARGCGHYHVGQSISLMGPYQERRDYCPSCAEDARTVQTADGEVLVQRNVNVYQWSDGLYYFRREPGIVGGRHSGKDIVGYVPPLSGASRESVLTLGMELEMQAFNGNDRDDMARALKNKLAEANLLDAKYARKYLHFEEDGSTGPGGFEMVTGYTDLATHGKLLKALLCKDNGRPAWTGKLRSHDASGESCGIHVHIQKPKHLLHAQKMRYFINSPASKKLVSDVSRRYNTSYARISSALGSQQADAAAAEILRRAKGRDRKASAHHETSALHRLNIDNRYEALNFQNAHTVEFRIFRGSMLYESVMACLEFTQAVWEFTKVTPATSINVENFIAFINRADNARSTANLRKYLANKGWATRLPNPVKGATAAPATDSDTVVQGPTTATTLTGNPEAERILQELLATDTAQFNAEERAHEATRNLMITREEEESMSATFDNPMGIQTITSMPRTMFYSEALRQRIQDEFRASIDQSAVLSISNI